MAALVGCERKGPEQTVVEDVRKIVLLSAGTDLGFENAQRSLLAGMMATKAHYQLQAENAQGKLDAQLAQFNAALESKPFAILLDALDAGPRKAELAAAVAKATSAGVLIIGLNETSLELDCTSVILADQRKLGKMAGELVVKALQQRSQEAGLPQVTGRVVEIRGLDHDLRCQLRHEGFAEALKVEPGVILVHDAPGNWTQDGGAERTRDAIRLQQTFDVIYAHNDLMALGAAKTMVQQERRDDMMIIGTDGFGGPDGGMTLVGDGEIDATIYQPFRVDFAWQLLQKKASEPSFQLKSRYELSPKVILPKDVDDIRRNGLPAYPAL